MANEISKLITPDGVSHDIKDSVARQASYDVSNKVDKTGDTMTGALTIATATSPSFRSKATAVDASKANNNVSSTQYPAWYVADNADRILSRVEGVIEANGNVGSYWYVRNYNTSGSLVAQKGIKMTVDKAGAMAYSIDDNGKFRNALGLATVAASGSYNDLTNKPTIPDISGKVNKSGDTMTGNLNVKSASMPANPTSGNLYLNGLYLQDAANDDYAYLRAHSASAEKGIQLEVRRSVNGSYVYNTLNMRINASGGRTIQVSDGAAWRSAIGANVALSTNEQSYTRNHASVSYTEHLRCWRYGNVVTLGGYFSCSGSIAANTLLYTLPSPKFIIYFTAKHETQNRMYNFNLQTNGQLKTNEAIAGGNYLVCFTYVCA